MISICMEGFDGRHEYVAVSSTSRCTVGADGAVVTEISTQSQRRAPPVAVAEGCQRSLLRVADRRPVEGDAERVWIGQRHSRLFSAMGGTGRVRQALATGVGGIRPVAGHRLGVDES